MTDLGDGRSLVWVSVARSADGFAGGPVALVEQESPRAVVHALGWLLVPSDSPHLQLVGDWLLIYANHCPTKDRCRPTVQLLLRQGPKFVNLALELDDGRCGAPALLPLLVQARTDVRGGMREFRLERKLRFAGTGSPIIDEHLSVFEYDDSADSPKILREQTSARPLTLVGVRLHAPPSLWAEVESEDLTDLAPDFEGFGTRRRT